METELRRSQSKLRILGAGMIAFALWAAIKPVLVVVLTRPEQAKAGEDALVELVFRLLLIILPNVGLRIFLGFSAWIEAMGNRKGMVYVILAFLVFAIQLTLLVSSLRLIIVTRELGENPLETIASLLLETTSMSTTGELAFTALKVKRLRGRLTLTYSG